MRYFFLMLSAVLLCAATFKPQEKAVITGKVTDEDNEALIGIYIVVQDNSYAQIGATHTDVDGQYRIELKPGVYTVSFMYTGYETIVVRDVEVKAGITTRLDQKMKSGLLLDEVVVTGYATEKIKTTSHSMSVTSSDIKSVPAGKKRKGKDKAAPAGEGAPVIKGSRESGTVYYIDGIRVDGAKPAADVEMREESPADIIETPPAGGPTDPTPKAGLLTGGEWNDLHNWNKHWTDLLHDGEIEPYQNQYKFYPKNRYAVLLQNQDDLPVVDALVRLADESGTTIWETRTDNMGRAELWDGLFSNTTTPRLQLVAETAGQRYQLGKAKTFADGLNTFRLERPCAAPNNVDIVWVVDATGSMGDEISYLKTELLDVMGRVQGQNPALKFRMGSVFYRDQSDEYIVKSSLLNADISQTVQYISQQSAGGGGDYPEAVHTALEEAVYRQPWSPSAAARICFLVLDASPHDRPDVVASLQKSIREAARLGIRIVPVAASGIQKDTEFLLKFFGLATNGTYTFLTDHSGIGNKHLEPTTDEYKVEAVNDMLVRIITEYSNIESCEGKSTIRSEENPVTDPQQQQPPAGWQAQYYPNPANTQVTLDLPEGVESVTVYNAEGIAVRKQEKPGAGALVLEVHDLPEGFYTLRILKDGQLKSGKLMVIHGS